MLIQIHSNQIPNFWENIKFACIKSEYISPEYQEEYCLTLLQDLLAGNKCCFIGKDNEKILAIFVLTFEFDKKRNIKILFFNNVYFFSHQEDIFWQEVFNDLFNLATKEKCKAIVGESLNDRIINFSISCGAKLETKRVALYF